MSPIACLLLSLSAAAQEAESPFVVPEGLEVRVWTESPRLYNPTAMDTDEQGRLYVAEAVNYRKWGGRNPGRVHEAGDRIVVLADTDGDGRCDTSSVFVQEERLVAPLGVCVVGEDVYVSCSPNVLRYRDTDGDGAADESEVFLTGFGGYDHDHGVHSLVLGADGYLYGAAGNAGPHLVTDAGGWRLRAGSLYKGGGPWPADNKPGLRSDDERVWVGGLIFRVRPDATGLEVVAHNFRNQYEVALDAYGNLYTADNDDDGNRACRTTWVLEGGNYGYTSEDGARSWQADQRPGQDTRTAHWHRDDPGVVPLGTINGAGGPTGVCVYEGRLLAPWIDGAVLNCDAGAGVVYAHRPELEGGAIELRPGELIRGAGDAEGARWFRPSDVLCGVDGAVYVSDWYDPGVGGHAAGDRRAYGRILRIAPVGAGATKVEGVGVQSPAPSVRNHALSALDPKQRAALRRSEDPRTRARAIRSVGQGTGGAGVSAGEIAAEPDVRVKAALVRSSGRRLEERMDEVWAAGSAWLRTVAAAHLARTSAGEVSVETLLGCAKHWRPDESPRIELEALGLVFAGREEAAWPLLEVALSPRRLDLLAWRLHPTAALPRLVARAGDEALARDLRRAAIDAIAFVPTQEAASAMHGVATTGPEDLRAYAGFQARHRATNLWRAFELPRELRESGFADAELVHRSELVREGMVEIDVDVEGARVLWLVVTDGGNGNACDWADWIEPTVVARDGERALAGEPWIEASTQWGSVGVDRNAAGGELRVDGELQRGLGTHAASRIAFPLAEGDLRFRARGAVDDGGTSQADGKATSVVFEVWVERPPARERLAGWIARLDDEEHSIEAVRALALDPEGGMWLVHQAQREGLSPALAEAAGEEIFQNPDLAVRALASEHFPRPGAEAELPPVSELLALEGDPARGRAVFFDERAQCSSCHALVRGDHRRGGDVGPELTAIAEKLGPAEILDAILNPSAAIAHGYDTWLIEDEGGRLYSGFLLADGDVLVVKDTQGRRHTLRAEEVASRHRQTLSTMPQGVVLGLNPQEIADLVAFLREPPEGTWVAGEERLLFDGRSLEGWTYHLDDPGARMEDVWYVRRGVLVCEGKPIGYLRTEGKYTNYVLELEWRFDPARGAGNSGVLLRVTGPDVVWPKSIEAQLHHRNAGDIWNIGEFDMDTDASRRSGRRTERLAPSSEHPLGEWNRYRITVAGERLELEGNGVLQNTARWCAEVPGTIALQSEGAPIEFRSIRLWPLERAPGSTPR